MADTVISEHFNYLHFTESTFEKPFKSGSTFVIPIKGVLPMEGYPNPTDGRALAGRILFQGVEKSTRTVTEYIGDPRQPEGFKEPYSEEDVPLPAGSTIRTRREYVFEGFQVEPEAWVDWVIWADSFEFVIENEFLDAP